MTHKHHGTGAFAFVVVIFVLLVIIGAVVATPYY
ncbi:YjcZ family sporulation protein [Evansella sp. AB-rgal1]